MIERSLSFSAWVYKENLASWQRVFDFGSGAGTDNICLLTAIVPIRQNGNPRNTSNRTLQVQDFWTLYEWQHVVAMVDESGVMKLYPMGASETSLDIFKATNETYQF